MSKFYAVKKGINPGLYTSWDECKKQIHGYSGAEYKSFMTEELAREYLGDEFSSVHTGDTQGYVIYVDGSFNNMTKEYSCGVVVTKDGVQIDAFSEKESSDASEMRNVAGELLGAKKAIMYAVKNDIHEITIVHDYIGISEWALGHWKTNKKWTQEYAAFVDAVQQKYNLKIYFESVKGHTGNVFNEIADTLAGNAMKY